MNKLIPSLQTIFVSLAHSLALGSFVYVAIMGTIYFDTLKSEQVSYLQSMLVYSGPLLALKISEAITAIRNGGEK